MSEEDLLKARLGESMNSFDGLLSLIPSQIYYGEESNDQWKRKKHSKAEKKAARFGKLDPDSEKNRTVKEVIEEQMRNKRKLEQVNGTDKEEDDEPADDDAMLDGIEIEQPLKKQKTDDDDDTKEEAVGSDAEDNDDDTQPLSSLSAKEQKRLLKKQKKLEKKAAKAAEPKEETDVAAESKEKPIKTKTEQEKKKEKEVERGAAEQAESAPTPQKKVPKVKKSKKDAATEVESEAKPQPKPSTQKTQEPRPSTEKDEREPSPDREMAAIDLGSLDAKDDETSTSSKTNSPVFDEHPPAKDGSVEPASAATSIASAVAPSEKPKHAKLPSSTPDAFKARLAARIEELRKARKADGADGKPVLTRAELIESRRQKQAQRKAHKKEVRQKAKEEADRKREEALASARTSPGSFMSPLRIAGSDAGDDAAGSNFAFGRIAFADGAQMSHDLSYVKDEKKKKGPSDPKTALAKLEAQKKRVAGMDEDKRKEVLEKETWLAARRRAEGEKVKDDEALLRKSVKRKEVAKKKSEKEWGERKAGVAKAIHDKQKKREDNLRKRRDEKMAGKYGKKKKGGPTKPGGGGKKARPGFEGTGLGGGRRK